MWNKLTNIIYVPFVVIGFIIAGTLAELSYSIHRKTGLPFFTSLLLAAAVLFILALAAVSTFKFIRNFMVTAVRTYAHNRQPNHADTEQDDDPSDTEADQ